MKFSMSDLIGYSTSDTKYELDWCKNDQFTAISNSCNSTLKFQLPKNGPRRRQAQVRPYIHEISIQYPNFPHGCHTVQIRAKIQNPVFRHVIFSLEYII